MAGMATVPYAENRRHSCALAYPTRSYSRVAAGAAEGPLSVTSHGAIFTPCVGGRWKPLRDSYCARPLLTGGEFRNARDSRTVGCGHVESCCSANGCGHELAVRAPSSEQVRLSTELLFVGRLVEKKGWGCDICWTHCLQFCKSDRM